MKLNLGCGVHKREGYINIDCNKDVHPDRLLNIEDIEFSKESIEEVYFSNVLEHLTLNDAIKILNKIFNWLKPKGKLFIAVPDMKKICKLISKGKRDKILFNWIYGEGGNRDSFNHRWGYTEKTLKTILEKIGFIKFSYFSDEPDDSSFCYEEICLSLNLVCEK